jgi:hypothetical protein
MATWESRGIPIGLKPPEALHKTPGKLAKN